MKLIRYGPAGQEKPGLLLEDGRRISTHEICQDYDGAFFASGGLEKLRQWLESKPQTPAVPEGARLGPPVPRPSKVVCAGLNYRKHAEETGAAIPAEPVLFMKAASAWSGPFDDVIIPPGSAHTDWEVELALVIGRSATRVPQATALDYVAGYAVMNDVSERAWQKERGGQWTKGKSADTFAPFGPWLVTGDEIDNPDNLPLWLKLNGNVRQSSSTADLIFPVAHLVSYISQFMTLLPGDVISTGTPSGVGMGCSPPEYLRPGDIMELSVQGLGMQRLRAVAG